MSYPILPGKEVEYGPFLLGWSYLEGEASLPHDPSTQNEGVVILTNLPPF